MTTSVKFSIFKQSPFFYFAFIFSACLHLLLIIGFQFDPPKKVSNSAPSLEVVLVNSKTKTAPTNAEVLAQANLNKGGNTSADKNMRSAVAVAQSRADKQTEIALKQLSTQSAKTYTTAIKKQQQLESLEKEAQSLMTQINSAHEINVGKNVTPNINPENTNHRQVKPTLNLAELMESSAQIARSEAQIAKQLEDYQKRPKRKSIGMRTQEYKYASYMEAWRLKVEKIGNLNYPEAAKEQKLYGQLQMTVSINADGSLEKVEIRRSSGHKILDAAAKRIVELAAPYSPFSEDMRKETDIIDITRTWSFTKEDSLSTKSTE
jgi:periplasmic protein TonB